MAIMNQNSEMFELLLESKSDITKKELLNNESVRDSVFRYCPDDYDDYALSSFLSMEFLMGKTKSIMDVYREHEARLMLDTLTKNCQTSKEKIIKVLLNFRYDIVFIKCTLAFFTRSYFGKDGPLRLKQVAMLLAYLLLLLVVWIMNGPTKMTISTSLVFLLSLLTFAWVGFFSYDTRTQKLNVMADSKIPNHLLSRITRLIDQHDFEKLEHEAYEANLHCYECLIVQSPQMYHCRSCGSCMDFHHKHSDFLGKCIGRDNAIAYFWFLVTNAILNALFVTCLTDCIASGDQEPASGFLKLVGSMVTIYEQNCVFFGSALLFVSYFLLRTFDKLLQLSLAIANRATVRELSDLWMHTHLFKVERDDAEEDPLAQIHHEIAELETGRGSATAA